MISHPPLEPLLWPVNWSYALGIPSACADIKTHFEDFIVTEDLGFQPCGEGEHVYLDITKTDINTDFLARSIAKFAGVPIKQVTYSGLKDRRGITRQWFGVHLPGLAASVDPDWPLLQSQNVQLHQVIRHQRKLKTGVHQGNFFTLRLRNIKASEELETRLVNIKQQGAPNYFGGQRFGRGGSNLNLALQLGQGKRIKDRFKRGMALSSIRSYLFNQLLSARVSQGTWLEPMMGERCMFSDGFSQFNALEETELEAVQQRIVEGDLAPTGMMPGRLGEVVDSKASRYEASILEPWQPWIQVLGDHGLSAQRRSLRLWPKDFGWRWCEHDVLELKFHLMRGSYATALVRELAKVQQVG